MWLSHVPRAALGRRRPLEEGKQSRFRSRDGFITGMGPKEVSRFGFRYAYTFGFDFDAPRTRHGTDGGGPRRDRKSTRLNSSHVEISYAVFCLKKKNKTRTP